jgi:hypothetical protein
MKRTRRLTCKDKSGVYTSRKAANDAMWDFYRRNFGGVKSPNASVYPCSGHFHWGHSRPRKR